MKNKRQHMAIGRKAVFWVVVCEDIIYFNIFYVKVETKKFDLKISTVGLEFLNARLPKLIVFENRIS